jgi:N-acetylmuramoyl-L-alanine amidase-like protein
MVVPKGIMGVVMHTMVGNLPGTITVFNQPNYQASAHFGIDQNGHIHQFGPVNGWMAWAQEAGNPNWYSIEHADNGNPDNPLTDAQLTASAQVVEALATHGSFPLQEANGAIRNGSTPAPPGPGGQATVVSDGTVGLAALAAKHGTFPATILRATAEAALPVGEYVPPLATCINTVFATDSGNMPDNLVLHYQENSPTEGWRNFSWQTGPAQHPEDPQPLHSLAQFLNTDCESIIRVTAEMNPGGLFSGPGFDYINGVFSRSPVLLPSGLTLYIK